MVYLRVKNTVHASQKWNHPHKVPPDFMIVKTQRTLKALAKSAAVLRHLRKPHKIAVQLGTVIIVSCV